MEYMDCKIPVCVHCCSVYMGNKDNRVATVFSHFIPIADSLRVSEGLILSILFNGPYKTQIHLSDLKKMPNHFGS